MGTDAAEAGGARGIKEDFSDEGGFVLLFLEECTASARYKLDLQVVIILRFGPKDARSFQHGFLICEEEGASSLDAIFVGEVGVDLSPLFPKICSLGELDNGTESHA